MCADRSLASQKAEFFRPGNDQADFKSPICAQINTEISLTKSLELSIIAHRYYDEIRIVNQPIILRNSWNCTSQQIKKYGLECLSQNGL